MQVHLWLVHRKIISKLDSNKAYGQNMVGICMLKMYIKSVCKILEFVVKSYLVQGIFGSELKNHVSQNFGTFQLWHHAATPTRKHSLLWKLADENYDVRETFFNKSKAVEKLWHEGYIYWVAT